MEKIKESGLAKWMSIFFDPPEWRTDVFGFSRSIGVSNFEVDDLEQLLAVSNYDPAVNQVIWSPNSSQSSIVLTGRFL